MTKAKGYLRMRSDVVKDLTEKWKHLKLCFPERQISFPIVRSAAHLAGQSGVTVFV
jgi:hypothetical protein